MKRDKTKSTPPPNSSHKPTGRPVLAKAPPHRLPGQPFITIVPPKQRVYDKNFHPESFIKHCAEGKWKAEILAAWGIHSNTLARWLQDHPEMKDAYLVGKECQKASFAQHYRATMNGEKKANPILTLFGAKNILDWSDSGNNDLDDVGGEGLDIDEELDETE